MAENVESRGIRNYEREFSHDHFKKKSKFDSK